MPKGLTKGSTNWRERAPSIAQGVESDRKVTRSQMCSGLDCSHCESAFHFEEAMASGMRGVRVGAEIMLPK